MTNQQIQKLREEVEYFSFALEEALRYIEGKTTVSADPIAVVQQAKKNADELLNTLGEEEN
jgi:hypothetical protein